MFPVTRQYLIRYRIEGNEFATLIHNIINRNSKEIIQHCQKYLDDYASGIHPQFSTNIDFLLDQLYSDAQ